MFTLYVQKNCLKVTPSADPVESVTDGRGALRINTSGQRPGLSRPNNLRPASSRAEPVGANTVCNRAWSFERVQGFELETIAKRRRRVSSRQACQELCLGEKEFSCRLVATTNSFSTKLEQKKTFAFCSVIVWHTHLSLLLSKQSCFTCVRHLTSK